MGSLADIFMSIWYWLISLAIGVPVAFVYTPMLLSPSLYYTIFVAIVLAIAAVVFVPFYVLYDTVIGQVLSTYFGFIGAIFHKVFGIFSKVDSVLGKKRFKNKDCGVALGCADDEDEDGGLCYKKCPSNYHGVGPVCWRNKMKEKSASIKKAKLHCDHGKVGAFGKCWEMHTSKVLGIKTRVNKAVGTPHVSCPHGYGLSTDHLHNCIPKCGKDERFELGKCVSTLPLSKPRGAGKPIHTCRDGRIKRGALCYHPCKAGFHPLNCDCVEN